MFNPDIYDQNDIDKTKKLNGREAIYYKRQFFRSGFLFKDFSMNHIQIDSVKPTIEEV